MESVQLIQLQVSHFFNIPIVQLLGRSRKRNIAEARHMAVFVCKKKTKCSPKEIGYYFNRDRTTVLSSIKKASDLMEVDVEMEKAFNVLISN